MAGSPIRLSTDTPLAELKAWSAPLERAGQLWALMLVHGFRLVQDANRMKCPLSRATRLHLSIEALERAADCARKLQSALGVSMVMQALDAIAAQYQPHIVQCIDAYHAERLSALSKTTSGPRQLKATRATLAKIAQRVPIQFRGSAGSRMAEVVQYWQDQESLLSQYETPE